MRTIQKEMGTGDDSRITGSFKVSEKLFSLICKIRANQALIIPGKHMIVGKSGMCPGNPPGQLFPGWFNQFGPADLFKSPG